MANMNIQDRAQYERADLPAPTGACASPTAGR